MSSRPKLLASVQDWFFDAISFGHDQTIRLVLELDGRVDEPRLARALRLLAAAEPVVGCRFAPGLFRAHWVPRDDLDTLELSRFVLSSDVQRDMHAFMAVSIDPQKDPLVQLRVFRSENDTICIKVSHVAMDGGGFKQLVYRMTSLYRTLAVDRSAVPLPDAAIDRGQGPILRLLPLRARLRAFLTQPFHKKRWSFPFTEGVPSDFTFSARTADVSVPALREAARSRGATITDALVTSFVRAIFAMTDTAPDLPLPFTLAIDLRRYLPAEQAAGLCNLSSLTWIELRKKAGEPIDETLRHVHGALVAAMTDIPGVGLAVVMEITSLLGYTAFRLVNRLRAAIARRQGREFPSLSNIGVMDPKVLDFGDARLAQARFFGPVFFPPTFYLVSGSFEDTFYFAASYPKSVIPGDLLERILDRIVSEIGHIVKNSNG
jgi:NRPS condensation-like uncharacterized protein